MPEQLRKIYGDVNPCEDLILNPSLDEIKGMDEREYGYYKIQTEKCESYKLAIIELATSQTEQLKSQQETIFYFFGIIVAVIIWNILDWTKAKP